MLFWPENITRKLINKTLYFMCQPLSSLFKFVLIIQL